VTPFVGTGEDVGEFGALSAGGHTGSFAIDEAAIHPQLAESYQYPPRPLQIATAVDQRPAVGRQVAAYRLPWFSPPCLVFDSS
jgi:hypothetical protein